MNNWSKKMKNKIAWNTSQVAGFVTGLMLLMMASGALAQVDRAELGRALELDLLPVAMPSEMEVTGLNLDSGIVYLDEESYSLELLVDGASLLESPRLTAGFDLESLQIGERVIVETDGTAPSDTHAPLIIAIRRP